MAFTLDYISLGIGLIIGIVILIFILILTKKKKSNSKTSLPTLKGYLKSSHNHMVEAANDLIKVYQVFNEIDNEH